MAVLEYLLGGHRFFSCMVVSARVHRLAIGGSALRRWLFFVSVGKISAKILPLIEKTIIFAHAKAQVAEW